MEINKLEVDNNQETSYNKKTEKNMNKNLVVISIIVFVLIALGAIVAFVVKPDFSFLSSGTSASPSSSQQDSEFVSVFLTNNQVYFGKISNLDSNYPSLKDVYYLRVQTSLVPAADNTSTTGVKVEDKNKATPAPAQGKQELTLVKLGNELHGPTDEIQLNRSQILYIEALKSDSKVVKAILLYEAKSK